MNSLSQLKYPYLVTVIGVALMAATAVFDVVRAMMFRPAFRNGFGGTGFNGTRQFVNPNINPVGFGFGAANVLVIVAVVVALIGVVWLGIVLRKPSQAKSA